MIRRSEQYNSDYMSREMDERLEQLEERLTALYANAALETQSDFYDFMEKYKKDYEVMLAKLNAEKITKAEFDLWCSKKILKTTQYKEMLATLTNILVNTDVVAMAIIKGQLPFVVAQSYNFAQSLGFAAADKAGLSVGTFQVYNAWSVQKIIKDNPKLLPNVDIPLDKQWNHDKINTAITHSIIHGDSIPKVAKRLREVTNMDKNSATRNARTSMTGAENLGRNEAIKFMKKNGVPVQLMWSSTHDSRTRDTHLLLDRTFQNEKGYFGEGILSKLMKFPGDPEGLPQEIYNCFVGDTNVCTDSKIIRTYKHEYQGKLVTVKTASGVEFTCTLNHPILTLSGWVAAESLNNGDDIIVTFRKNKIMFRRNPNIKHGFSRFDTLHELFNKIGSKRTCTLGVNFHGDIPTTEVEIITQKRFLRNDRNTGRCKFINKLLFVLANKTLLSNSSFMKHLRSIRLATLRLICKRSNSLAFFLAGLRHSKVHGLRPIALLDTSFVEPLCDGISGSVELLSKSIDGFTGFIFSDKIVSIDVNERHTHVYNLQSENGYYFVNSIINPKSKGYNGIVAVAHNCRCRASIYLEGIDHSKDAELYDKFMTENYPDDYRQLKQWEEKTGRAEERRQTLEYQKVLKEIHKTGYYDPSKLSKELNK